MSWHDVNELLHWSYIHCPSSCGHLGTRRVRNGKLVMVYGTVMPDSHWLFQSTSASLEFMKHQPICRQKCREADSCPISLDPGTAPGYLPTRGGSSQFQPPPSPWPRNHPSQSPTLPSSGHREHFGLSSVSYVMWSTRTAGFWINYFSMSTVHYTVKLIFYCYVCS